MTRKTVKFDINPLLSGPSLQARVRSGSPFRLLPISDIDVDPDQPRRVFNDEALRELAESIKEYGVLCPILVRISEGGTYRLIAGERRYRACQLLELETIPALIDDDESDQPNVLGKQLVENLQRQDLTPMERALAFVQFKDKYSLSIREIARTLGVSKSLVQRSLELLSLPDDLQAALIAGASESKVLVLAQLEDRTLRKEYLAKLNEISREELEHLVRDCSEGEGAEVSHGGTRSSAKKEKTSALSVEDRRIREDIQRSLGTRVHLQRAAKKKGQGKLVIEFYSSEDLSEIYRRLTIS